MNENVMSLLDAELEHAGEGTALSPQMLLLEQLRITPEKELKPMEFLFITQYKFYNKLLQRAQDEKVIVKVERDRHTFYHPSPF